MKITVYTGLLVALLIACASAKDGKTPSKESSVKEKRELPVGPGHAYLPPPPSHSYLAAQGHSSGPSASYLAPHGGLSYLAPQAHSSGPSSTAFLSSAQGHSFLSGQGHASGPSASYLPPVHSSGVYQGHSHGSGLGYSSLGYGAGGPAASFVNSHLGKPTGYEHKNVATYIIASGIAGGKGQQGSYEHGSHGIGGGYGYAAGSGAAAGGYKVETVAIPAQTYGPALHSSGHGAYSTGGQGHVDRGYSVGAGSGHGQQVTVVVEGGHSDLGSSNSGYSGHSGLGSNSGYSGHSDLGSGTGYSDSVGYSHGDFSSSSLGEHSHVGSAGESAFSFAAEGSSGQEYSSIPSVPNSYSHSASGPVDFSAGHGFSGFSHGGPGYTYSGDASSQTSHTIPIPAPTYGVPLAPPLTSYTPNYQSGSSSFSSSVSQVGGSGNSLPGYAAGHKGLGHYQSAEVAETGKAPFKPSVFLGATHESHNIPAPSSEYLPAAKSFETSGHHGGSHSLSQSQSTASYTVSASTQVQEPSNSYLSPTETHYVSEQRPQQTYGAPHAGAGRNYLPPSTSYGAPSSSYNRYSSGPSSYSSHHH